MADHPRVLRAAANILDRRPCEVYMLNQTCRDAADEIERLQAALRLFVGCAYPVATEINPRGHAWRPEESLDYALSEAKKVLGSEQ